jgi:PKD repeat protein
VSFTPGIRQTFPDLRVSSGSFVDSGSGVFGFAVRQTFPGLRLTTGSFVDSGSGVFGSGKRFTFPDLRVSSGAVFEFPDMVSSNTHHLYISVLVPHSGDDTKHMALGISIDFVGVPRIGRKPLSVEFDQLCRGPIKEFYWLFGDGNHSYHSTPSNIYKRVGVYTVSLRGRIGNRYYTNRKIRYIIVLAGDLIVSTTDTALRCAITKDQGIGMYRMPVTGMPMPEARVGCLNIVDANGVSRGLVLDASTGKWYDVTTREVNGETTTWKGIDGANLVRSILFGEDHSRRENEKLRFGETHLGIRPIKEENRDETGYDENGFPDGMEAQLNAYVDGEPTTPIAKIRAIPFDGELKIRGDLKTDKKIGAARIQWELITNRGAHCITDRQANYIISRKSGAPPMRTMQEANYQRELNDVLVWPAWINGVLRNRRTGAQITTADGATAVLGLDGRTGSALRSSTELIFPSSTPPSVMLWASGTIVVKIGSNVLSMTAHDTVVQGATTWTLYYADSLAYTGTLSITPSGSVDLFDIRAFSAALSSAARTYYFEDVDGNEGKVVLPR